MKLYFGNGVTTATTILLFVLLGFLGDSIWHRENIVYWGRRTLFVLLFGLLICCFAAARDGLDKTIQHAIDGSCAPGLFPLVSVPTLIGCVGAALILIAAIAAPHRQIPGAAGGLVLSRLCGRHAEDPDRRNLPAPHPLILTYASCASSHWGNWAMLSSTSSAPARKKTALAFSLAASRSAGGRASYSAWV